MITCTNWDNVKGFHVGLEVEVQHFLFEDMKIGVVVTQSKQVHYLTIWI